MKPTHLNYGVGYEHTLVILAKKVATVKNETERIVLGAALEQAAKHLSLAKENATAGYDILVQLVERFLPADY